MTLSQYYYTMHNKTTFLCIIILYIILTSNMCGYDINLCSLYVGIVFSFWASWQCNYWFYTENKIEQSNMLLHRFIQSGLQIVTLQGNGGEPLTHSDITRIFDYKNILDDNYRHLMNELNCINVKEWKNLRYKIESFYLGCFKNIKNDLLTMNGHPVYSKALLNKILIINVRCFLANGQKIPNEILCVNCDVLKFSNNTTNGNYEIVKWSDRKFDIKRIKKLLNIFSASQKKSLKL